MLLLDPDDRLLLIECISPDEPQRRFWITSGGGIEQGESREVAAQRELWEEAGIAEAVLGPLVWRRRHRFEWAGRILDQREEFLMGRTPRFQVCPRGLGQDEMKYLLRFRWWTLQEIRDAGDAITFAPRRLGALLHDLLESGPPPTPIDSGI